MVTLEQFSYCPTHSTHPPFCYDFHYVKSGMVAIFGDNGSGKSTLAQLMAGWYPDFLPGEITGTGRFSVRPLGISRLMNNPPPSSSFSNRPICSSPAVPLAWKKKLPLGQKICVLLKKRLWRGLMLP